MDGFIGQIPFIKLLQSELNQHGMRHSVIGIISGSVIILCLGCFKTVRFITCTYSHSTLGINNIYMIYIYIYIKGGWILHNNVYHR